MRRKIAVINAHLDNLFPNPPIPLIHSDPYTLLIATLLSAQCTDKRVNTITPLLPKTPQEMITWSVEEIRAVIRPCGLSPFKSKAIWELSYQLLAHHEGKVPPSFEALEALPGVGHKTASCVMSHAFDIPAFPIDTHIHRCANRWGLSCGTSVKKTESDLKALFPKTTWHKRHLQIIYYARAYCPAIKHEARKCPICYALSHGMHGSS